MLILSYILNKSNQRYQMARQLNEELSSLSNIYLLVYDIDIIGNTFKEIKSEALADDELSEDENRSASSILEDFIRNKVNDVSLNDMINFVNINTLNERLHDSETVALEYRNKANKWRRARFIETQRQKNGNVTHVLWLIEDIDKEKTERDTLINLSERAFAASDAKSSFLSNMSHEIRTPINAILGMNEMILRECEDTEILAYSESIKTAGNTLLGLVNDILDFSKIEAGKIEIIPVNYDLSSLINDLVNMIQIKADDKGLALALDFDKNLPKLLHGDEIRIKQVITNILTNSVKYTEKGSITFSIGFKRIEDEPDSVILLVSVKDTGIGIKPEDMKKLFMEFERIEEERNRNVEGTGLGMAITKNLLYLMETNLNVESVYGFGTKFSFELKQKVVKWEPLGNYEESYKSSLSANKKYKEKFIAPAAQLLVVDDNPMNLMVFKSLLKQTKVKIDMANSGDEAILLTQDKKYDIIFLDHRMPGMDGIETLHEIRRELKNPNLHTIAICLTANAISGAREQYMAEGFDNYLTKPIDSGKLEEMLMTYLPKKKIEMSKGKYSDDKSTAKVEIPAILAPLNGKDWIDLTVGIKNSGSVDAYMPLLKIFYESMYEKAGEIEKFYSEGDIKNYTIKVHALKSSAKIIGAIEFADKAQKLEDAGKNGDIDYIHEHHSEFMNAYRTFHEPLAQIFEGNDEDKPEADADLMAAVYEEIKSAAEEMDSDRLDAIFEEISEYRIPAAEEKLWKQIKSAADRFDYEAIQSILKK
ncbi:MAG: response regulator [Selenomonadaceae bacterium]|nr:response regulator [Selenomonadaceae bacterium]